MKLFIKLLALAFFFAALIVATFVLWGEAFDQRIYVEGLLQAWAPLYKVAWLGGVALLMSDVFLPVPSTVVLSALGAVYGFALGTLAGTVGLVLAGCVGYGLGRLMGPKVLSKLASPKEVEQARCTVSRWGGWAVVLSRSMPIFPEVVSIMAGLTSMPFRRFFAALVLGSFPMAGLFSYIGVYALEKPGWGLALSVVFPALLWAGASVLASKKKPDD